MHLFTQLDWHVVAITCLLFAYYQVERGTKVHAPVASLLQIGAEWETLLVTGLLGTSGVIFGPGAAASFGLAIREQSLRAAAQPAKCQ